MRHRVAFVIQRYGEGITGGSESLCRQIAERMTRYYDVEVLTTTALDHLTWTNDLPAGRSELREVAVHRFPCATERNPEFQKTYDRIFSAQLSLEEEHAMVRQQGPYCPALIEHLQKCLNDYDAFVFFTYLYYPACVGLPLVKSKAAFVPTAHDEPFLYLHLLDDLFQQTPFLIFISPEERHLLQRRFNLPADAGRAIGMGMESCDPGPPDPAWDDLAARLGERRVIAYLGRVESGKGCEELVDFFRCYAGQSGRRNVVLLLLGKRSMPIPDHPQILSTGYVSEYVKQQVLHRAEVVIASSPFESLSITALEALLSGTPLLVNGRCDVLVGHCLRSNGGLWYRDFEEFSEALTVLLDDAELRREMGSRGKTYVEENYRCSDVEQAYRDVLDSIIAGGKTAS